MERQSNAVAEAAKLQKDTWKESYQPNLDKTRTLIEKFGPDGFKDFLNTTELGNHPLMIAFCLNLANAVSEDYAPKGGGPAGEGVPAGEAGQMIYDKSPDLYKGKK